MTYSISSFLRLLAWVCVVQLCGAKLAAEERVVGIVGIEKADHAYVAFKAGMQEALETGTDAEQKAVKMRLLDFTPRSERWEERLKAFENAVGEGCTVVFYFYKCREAIEPVREAGKRAGVELVGVHQQFVGTNCGWRGTTLFAPMDSRGNGPLAGRDWVVLEGAAELEPYVEMLFMTPELFMLKEAERRPKVVVEEQLLGDTRLRPELVLVGTLDGPRVREKLDAAGKGETRLLTVGWGPEPLMALDSGALEVVAWYDYEESGQRAMRHLINDKKQSLIRVNSMKLITKAEAQGLLEKWEKWLAEPAR